MDNSREKDSRAGVHELTETGSSHKPCSNLKPTKSQHVRDVGMKSLTEKLLILIAAGRGKINGVTLGLSATLQGGPGAQE